MSIKLDTLEAVRAEYERIYNEADADPDGSVHTKLRILQQAHAVLQQTALEQKLELIEAELDKAKPLRRVV
jgi:hypothetical protein